MRWTLISFFCIATISNVVGQTNTEEDRIEGVSPINIGLEEVNNIYTPSPYIDINLKSAISKESNISVTYVNFPEKAKIAFEYAVSIWEQSISSTVPINILAKYEYLQGNTLAESRPAYFYKNFPEAPFANVYYPVALTEKLSGREYNGSKEADIICSFKEGAAWYWGTDGNTYQTDYDFVTVVLHEITHGLGMSGFFVDENGSGKYCNPTNTPSAYDFYLFNNKDQQISNNTLFPSPSIQLNQQLTSNSVKFNYSNNTNEKCSAGIFSPNKWNDGSSIYHLEATNTTNGEANELMTPYTYKGEANHNPGEKTLNILSEIGWSAISFKLTEISDIEETCDVLPIGTSMLSSLKINNSSVKVIFSTDYFKTKDSVLLSYNANSNLFEGDLALKSHKGKVQYYFTAKSADNKTVTYPSQAPESSLKFKIGADYYTPTLQHNPSRLIVNTNPTLDLSAIASDNLGIQSVCVEYKINGTEQKPFLLTSEDGSLYSGKLRFPLHLNYNDVVEYRVVAKDNSNRGNIKFSPSNGYYKVEVFEPFEPVSGYYSDFNSSSEDFTTTDFNIATPAGFSDGNLHTMNPYPQSALENEKYNLIAQLNYPVILEENGQMSFDEIVLVEPGEEGTHFTDDVFWDYVIVEASKNNGASWEPLADGYDSGINESWKSQFTTTLKSASSVAAGHENMFWQHNINLTENGSFAAGDTVLFRFRLASDKSVNGWGWAIDNLKIQNINTANDDILAKNEVSIYPNPCTNSLFFDCANMSDHSTVEIMITDLTGKTVLREKNIDTIFNPKLKIDLSSIKSGVYLASITDANYNTTTQRIIKH